MYTIAELVAAAEKEFGYSRALVDAALKATGRTEFFLEEAREIISDFANQEVTD